MIIAIEGCSYSGKTTLARLLVDKYLGSTLIPEYNEIAGGSKNFPPPPQTEDDAIKAVQFFIELEHQRQRLIQKALAANDNKLIVQDRSLLTCIAFDYAIAQLGRFDVWNQSQQAFLSQKFLLPDIILFLAVNQETIMTRKSKDNFQIPKILISPDFNYAFEQYFRKLRLSRIIWLDANASMEAVYQEACDRLLSEF